MSTRTSSLALFFLFLLYLPYLASSSACAAISTEELCTSASKCSWDTDESTCQCATSTPLDIQFWMDNSGSMGKSHFELQQTFIANLLSQSISNESRVGIYKFGYRNRDVWPLDDPQSDRTEIIEEVSDTKYNGDRATKIADAALEAAEEFTKYEEPNDRVLFILTDGNPYPSSNNPCDVQSGDTQSALEILTAMDPYVDRYIIGMGSSWTAAIIDCFVDDPDTQVIEIDDWSTDAFTQLQEEVIEAITCPESWDVIITEIRINPLEDTITYDAQFFEFYVLSDVYLNASSMVFGGLVSTRTSFGNCNIYLPADAYVVIYNPDNPNNLECVGCDCTADGNLCGNAIYIACGPSTGECGLCDWNDGYGNSNWMQNISDGDSLSVISSAEYTSSFSSIVDGWSYELLEISAGTSSASNWEQSCNYTGTPGAGPLSSCNVTCDVTTCQVNGDTSASCKVTDICECNSDNHYFQYGSTCVLLGPPTDCSADPQTYNGTFSSNVVSWVAPSTSATITYYYTLNPGDESGTTTKKYYFYYFELSQSNTLTVMAGITIDGTPIYSTVAGCSISTMVPTEHPTPSPTSSIPPTSNCVATLGKSAITLVWDAADESAGTGPETISYYVFGRYDTTINDTDNNIGTVTTSTSESLSPLASTSDPSNVDISVVVVVYDTDNERDTERMLAANGSIAVCSVQTMSPTPLPTEGNTSSPTAAPSYNPSPLPTSSPTYASWRVDSCQVTVDSGPSAKQISLFIEYTAGGDSSAVVRLYINSNAEYLISSIFPTATEITKTKVFDFTPDGNDNYGLRLTFKTEPGGDNIHTDEVNCTVITSEPTPMPTKVPSQTPSASPSKTPTLTPSKSPSTQPTPSPIYGVLSLPDTCSYNITRDGTITLTFIEPVYASEGEKSLPDKTMFTYKFAYNNGESYTIQPDTSELVRIIQTISFTSPFDSSSTATLSVVNAPDQDDVSVDCVLYTFGPTPSPITGSPTPYPTLVNPNVFLDINDGWGFADECNFNRRRMFEEDYGKTFVQCQIYEDSEKHSIVFRRTPSSWPYDIFVTYRIIYVDSSETSSKDLDSSDFNSADSESFFTQKNTTFTFPPRDETFSIDYEVEVDSEDEEYDFFVVLLIGCENDNSQVPFSHEYTCNQVITNSEDDGYLSWVRIQIITQSSGDTFSVITLGDLPTWIWYAIGAALIAVPIIIYLIWRFRNQKKLAEIMEEQKKNELVEAENMDDVGNFGELGDNVVANPLATGGTFEITKQDEVIQHQLDEEILNFEIATVEVENNWFKQDFGPVMAEQHEIDESYVYNQYDDG